MVEPWPGLYTDRSARSRQRSNYALREGVLELRRRRPGGVTAVSCCGANPGMVSWMVKQALLDVARDLDARRHAEPQSREDWARLMQRAGVKGIHIAERDTQRAARSQAARRVRQYLVGRRLRRRGPAALRARLGHAREGAAARAAHRHDFGCDAAIYLTRPGAGTRVRSWTPTAQAQHGLMVTHNESISIADYFTLREDGKVGR